MSRDDHELIARALALPGAAAYHDAGWARQRLFALCGPTSAVNVLRSLGVAARPSSVLAGTGVGNLLGLRLAGMTLDQLALVVRHHGRRATVLRDLDLAALRAELARLDDPRRRYVLNFLRRPLFGWGGGHHSPIVAYLEDVDRALILDVNARVGPWLASSEQLHAAIRGIDPASGRARGLLLVE